LAAASAASVGAFQADLRAALQIASNSTTTKHRLAQNSHFQRWLQFCANLGVDPSLRTISSQDDKLSYLLVFGLRYRQTGANNKSVRAGSVDSALLAVGQGISHLGERDPRKQMGSDKLHPILSSFLASLGKEDAPTDRAYPVNTTILRQLPEVLDTDHIREGTLNQHVIDLVIVAFFWLLRPAEYTDTPDTESRSQAFLFQHIHLCIDGMYHPATLAPLNDRNVLDRVDYASLEFLDQKNGVRGEQVGHKATSDPWLCPAKALARIAIRLPLRSSISIAWA
jgi:hypothetical protein